jgi:hypothetical protein
VSSSPCPADTKFTQQELPACKPLLTPKWVIFSFFIVGVVFIPIGAAALIASRGVSTFLGSHQAEGCLELLQAPHKLTVSECSCHGRVWTNAHLLAFGCSFGSRVSQQDVARHGCSPYICRPGIEICVCADVASHYKDQIMFLCKCPIPTACLCGIWLQVVEIVQRYDDGCFVGTLINDNPARDAWVRNTTTDKSCSFSITVSATAGQ